MIPDPIAIGSPIFKVKWFTIHNHDGDIDDFEAELNKLAKEGWQLHALVKMSNGDSLLAVFIGWATSEISS